MFRPHVTEMQTKEPSTSYVLKNVQEQYKEDGNTNPPPPPSANSGSAKTAVNVSDGLITENSTVGFGTRDTAQAAASEVGPCLEVVRNRVAIRGALSSKGQRSLGRAGVSRDKAGGSTH
ncbi:hypothetical protein Trydic_g3365 [Trypoxylus dichotomus]